MCYNIIVRYKNDKTRKPQSEDDFTNDTQQLVHSCIVKTSEEQQSKNETRQKFIDDSIDSASGDSSIKEIKKQTLQKRQESSKVDKAPAKKRRAIMPNDSQQYEMAAHLPEVDRKIRARCKKCQKKTSFFCIKCRLHLCIVDGRNCFKDFHTKKSDDKLPSTENDN